jgi:hypothetical protein
MDGFDHGHAINSGKVVVVKFVGPPLTVDRASVVRGRA